MKLIVTDIGNDQFQAKIEGQAGFGVGRSPTEAVGDLIHAHPETFGLTIEISAGAQQQLARIQERALKTK
jgi:hypothetical protein